MKSEFDNRSGAVVRETIITQINQLQRVAMAMSEPRLVAKLQMMRRVLQTSNLSKKLIKSTQAKLDLISNQLQK